MGKYYITTAIAYVNAPPHIGHALEFIQADALARYHRLKEDDTFFLTGTDEHGVKIYETAKEQGISTQELVDKNAEIFKSLEGVLTLSNDGFVRTSLEEHRRGARKLWQKLVDAGDIYKDVYKGNYCAGCESFIAEKDLDENGQCPNHKKKPKILEEENYFFKLSKYSDKIRKLIEKDELKVVPNSRKNEMLNIIGEDGLKDVSFSRPKSVLPWGVPVPDDETQVMYVWCDALSNYITALDYENEGELYKKYWPADVHLIGKDILRFHAGIWPGMLLAAGIELPRSIYVHGFITSEGQKMSKSLGNTVDPLEYVEKYGVDALRYYLLREIPTADDGDFSHGRFTEVFNSELANGIGNLVNRITMMIDKYADGKVPAIADKELLGLDELLEKYKGYFETFNLKKACESVFAVVDLGNKYIDDKKPWALAKEGSADVPVVLYNLLELIRILVYLLYPIIPTTAEKIAGQIGLNTKNLKFDFEWGGLKEGQAVSVEKALFPRMD